MNTTEEQPRLHGFLTKPQALERVPGWLTFLLLAGAVALAALLHPTLARPWRAGALLAFSLADWASLALLTRTGRSYGPVKPALLALAVLRAALTLALGWLLPLMWAVQAALLALSLYATWIEPFRLRVTYQTLRSPRLDPALPPLRLLHLGDLHVERLTPRERELQRLIDRLAPDLILFSGDFVNLSYRHDLQAERDVRRVVEGWRAPLGVYCVSGTPLVETPRDVARFVEGTSLRWLRDEAITLDAHGQPLTLLGLDGAQRRKIALPRLHQTAERLPPGDAFQILLYHTPDIAPEAAELGFDLYLCGHTHGGQIRLPLFGAIVTASEWGKRFEMGRYRLGPMILYVTRGIGMEGGVAPRARLLCPPEITLWTLSGAPD